MEDEVFEKYLKRIEETYRVICDDWFSYNLDEDERKAEVKQILEEIEKNAITKCSENHGVCFYQDRHGKSVLKEAKP